MADKIKIKGGNGAVPALDDREMAYSKDEKALYIGTGSENIKLCNAELSNATPSIAQPQLEGTEDISGVINAFNNLISALKDSGLMKM